MNCYFREEGEKTSLASLAGLRSRSRSWSRSRSRWKFTDSDSGSFGLAAVWSTYLAFLFLQGVIPNDYQINGSDALWKVFTSLFVTHYAIQQSCVLHLRYKLSETIIYITVLVDLSTQFNTYPGFTDLRTTRSGDGMMWEFVTFQTFTNIPITFHTATHIKFLTGAFLPPPPLPLDMRSGRAGLVQWHRPAGLAGCQTPRAATGRRSRGHGRSVGLRVGLRVELWIELSDKRSAETCAVVASRAGGARDYTPTRLNVRTTNGAFWLSTYKTNRRKRAWCLSGDNSSQRLRKVSPASVIRIAILFSSSVRTLISNSNHPKLAQP